MIGDEEDDFETPDPARAQRRLKALQRHNTTPAANNKRKTPCRTPSSAKRPATVLKARPASSRGPASQVKEPSKTSGCGAVVGSVQRQHPSHAACGEPHETTSRLPAPQPQQLAACGPTDTSAPQQHLFDSEDDFHGEDAHAAVAVCHNGLDGMVSAQPLAEALQDPQAAATAVAAAAMGEQEAEDSQQHCETNKAVSLIDEEGIVKCPMCSCCLADVSNTEAGRAAHVNACLDAAAGVHAPAATMQAGYRQQEQQQQQQQQQLHPQQQLEQQQEQEQDIDVVHIPDDNIAEWLAGIGAAEVLDCFSEADVDISVLPHLNDHDLQEMGVADAAMRQRILLAAAQHAAGQGHTCTWDAAGSSAAAAGSSIGPDMQQWHQEQIRWEQQQMQQQEQQQGLAQQPMQPQDMYLESEQLPGQEHLDNDDDGDDDDGWCCDDNAGAYADGLDDWGDTMGDGSAAAEASAATAAGANFTAGNADGENQTVWHQWQQQWQQQWKPAVQGGRRQPLQPVQAGEPNSSHNGSTISTSSRSTAGRTVASDRQKSSIVGWLQLQQQGQQQKKQQQQCNIVQPQHSEQQKAAQVKQQWQSLFNRQARVLAPQQPLQQQQRPLNQQQFGREGQLQQQQQSGQVQPVLNLPRGRTADLPSWWPAWRRLPGTNIVVDCFGQSSKALGLNRSWILTHFHADHYMGLGKGFKQGRILCTPTTAALVRLKLRVPEGVLVPLELGQEVVVEGTRLQLIDANHCPGAAMVVAHPPCGAPPVLHTGDARLTAEATQQQPALQALVGKAVLVLDTTYANPAYCFPPQQEVLDWVLRAVRAESFNPRCLFLFGSYTIGKERLFLHVAQALKRKVYVAAAKRAVMSCLSLPPEQAALLTTNHLEANIHVVPMRQVNLAAMESLLVRYKGRYTAVVGFQPTGWSHAGPGGANSSGGKVGEASRSSSSVRPNRRLQRGTVVLYKVPYSEHSSCAELREFVSWFKPLRIIPSVNNDNAVKLRQMLAAVTASSSRVSGPMDAFARLNHQQQQQQQQQLEPLAAEEGEEKDYLR